MTEQYRGEQGLPDWLADVPVSPQENPHVIIEEGISVPRHLLEDCLELEVGVRAGVMSCDPEFAHLLAQFTEESAWKQLASEPTSIIRNDENSWTISIGENTRNVNADMLRGFLDGSFQLPSKDND